MLLATALGAAPGAHAAGERADVHMALMRYRGGNCNPRPHGLPRLAWEIRRRTSIAMGLETVHIDPVSPELFNYPLLVWQGEGAGEPLAPAAVAQLQRYLRQGGSLLIDASEGLAEGPFSQWVRRELAAIWPEAALARLPADHVLYRSFYLVDRHGGRVAARPYLEGIVHEGRLAVVWTANDLAGAMARGDFGEWEYDVGVGGDALREMTFRLGVNWVMYTLCLDYKDDQVHLPFILKRRR